MSGRRIRFALVGAGAIGRTHARALAGLPDVAELVTVVDLDPARARELAAQHGAEATTDLAAVLRRDDIDAVTICTPSGLNADCAVAALDAGEHVVVEKPIEVTLAAADRIIAAEERSGKTVAAPGPAWPRTRSRTGSPAGSRIGPPIEVAAPVEREVVDSEQRVGPA